MKSNRKRVAFMMGILLLVQLFAPWKAVTGNAETEPAKDALYVAPEAKGIGSKEDPMDLETAIQAVEPGQTIYMLEGTYFFSNTLKIHEGNDGTPGNYKTLSAYPGAKVVLDFSKEQFGRRGVLLAASYWHIFDITICNAGDNGMLLAGDYNILEQCIFEGNKDSGLQISRDNTDYTQIKDWPSYNYIVNCTSRNNADPSGENADGFAPKLTCGEGNVFDGCLSYNNVDDGWDCYAKSETGPIGQVTLINCIAFRNGQTESGTFTADSDGNGFKLGGGGIGTPHIAINCLAFENKNCGFTDNNNPTAISLINCTAFNNNLSGNKSDFNVYRCRNANAINILAFNTEKNSNKFQNMSANYVVYGKDNKWYTQTTYGVFDTTKADTKGDQVSRGLTAADFIQTESPVLGTDFHELWREADGSIDTLGYAMIAADSAFAKFSTDGMEAGARFGKGSEFVTPDNAGKIKEAAIAGNTAQITVAPTATVKPTVTPAPTATNTPVPTATNTPVPTATSAPTITVAPTATLAPTATTAPQETLAPEPTPDDVVTEEPLQTDNTVTIILICAFVCVVIIAVTTVIIIRIWKK